MAKKVEREDIRINKLISESGFCSRREADQLILDGRVTINGELATLGSRVVEGDKVKIDGEPLFFIPIEMREYKLRRNGLLRRGALDTKAEGERGRAPRSPHRDTRAPKNNPSAGPFRERGEGRKHIAVKPDKKEGTTRGKKVGEKSRATKAGSRPGGPGQGKSTSVAKSASARGRKNN